jgi:flagellar biosynthetic protein FlhB
MTVVGMAGEKTEKATPKRKEEARKKGQVAKSSDLGGSVILLAGLFALGSAGPAAARRMGDGMRQALTQISDPSVVSQDHIGDLLTHAGGSVLLAVGPIALVCALAAILVNVAQVGLKPSTHALKPDPKRLNPINGAKNIFGPNMLAEGIKSISKVGVVGAVVFTFVAPKITSTGAMVGIGPQELASALSSDIHAIAMRAALAYFIIGVVDYGYQRHRLEKSMKMELQEVKEEAKGQNLPPEVRAAMRRRQMSAARARMMADVPTADVIVTNPTHFAVALKYDGTRAAPMVIAKGQDLLALRIREIAKDAGVPRVENVPLARSLFATCEVGHEIPEDLYAAVAQVLAFVYRLKARRAA